MPRVSKIKRKTNETDIELTLNLDGNGLAHINSGNGFMDHMLTLFTKHGFFDFDLDCAGDIEVDFHHSAEDIGIVMGQAIDQALGEKKGIVRYATNFVPMDEALIRVCLDISGRPNLVYAVSLEDRKINNFECDLVQDFFKALCDHAKMTIHIDALRGRNSHHIIEGIFKAFGRSLMNAVAINQRAPHLVPSSKGTI